MQKKIQAERLVKLYGKKLVVDGVSLEVNAGEVEIGRASCRDRV